MCQVISVAVHPVTLEVFHKEGSWSHTEICVSHGLDYDKVFKPEIILANKSINFIDGPIALKRTVPPELLQELMLKMGVTPDQKVDALCQLSFVHNWTPEHETAVRKWLADKAGSATKLIDFAQHTWNRNEYSPTINTTTSIGQKFHQYFDFARPQSVRDNGILKMYWQRTFEKTEARVPVWR